MQPAWDPMIVCIDYRRLMGQDGRPCAVALPSCLRIILPSRRGPQLPAQPYGVAVRIGVILRRLSNVASDSLHTSTWPSTSPRGDTDGRSKCCCDSCSSRCSTATEDLFGGESPEKNGRGPCFEYPNLHR